MKSYPALIWRLWRRNRELRRRFAAAKALHDDNERKLEQARRRIEELEAELQRVHESSQQEGRRLRQLVLDSSSKAAAEHYQAFKWGHDYKVMELHLAAATSERDSYLHRMRELASRVEELEKELDSQRKG